MDLSSIARGSVFIWFQYTFEDGSQKDKYIITLNCNIKNSNINTFKNNHIYAVLTTSKYKKHYENNSNNMIEKFNNIMKFATDMVDINKYALVDIIKSLLFPMQYALISGTISKSGGRDLNYFCDFFWNDKMLCVWTEMRSNKNKVKIKDANDNFSLNLSRDVIISTPWHNERLLGTLSGLGYGKNKKPWRQDDNHKVETWLPWGISIVDTGNHSIAAGIISGDGYLIPNKIYDLSDIFKKVKCDGKNYIYIGPKRLKEYSHGSVHIKPNDIIGYVDNINTASVFEIGRIMTEKGIHAWPEISFAKINED